MTLTLPNQIEPLTPADAVEVEHNNTVITDYINTEVISRGGQVAMIAPLKLVNADPVNDDDAARKAYVDALLPIGTMMMYGGALAPAGRWRLCDGSSLQTAVFPRLFAVLQYSYGGSGGTFALPDLRHRVAIGQDAADARFSTVGKVGGSYDAALLQHFHTITHDHAQFNSGNQNADHTHKIDHNHGGFNTDAAGTHRHVGDYRNVNVELGASLVQPFVPESHTHSGEWVLSDPADGAHAHFIDIPNFVGNSGGILANHQHPINIPSFTGNSGNQGTAAAQQVPPFTTVNYIIRTD